MSRNCTLYVAGFNYATRPDDLAEEFSRFGRLIRCDIPGGKTFAFVEYANYRDAEDALDAMHGTRLNGRPLMVEFSRRPPPQSWRSDEVVPGEGGRGGSSRYLRDTDYDNRGSRSRNDDRYDRYERYDRYDRQESRGYRDRYSRYEDGYERSSRREYYDQSYSDRDYDRSRDRDYERSRGRDIESGRAERRGRSRERDYERDRDDYSRRQRDTDYERTRRERSYDGYDKGGRDRRVEDDGDSRRSPSQPRQDDSMSPKQNRGVEKMSSPRDLIDSKEADRRSEDGNGDIVREDDSHDDHDLERDRSQQGVEEPLSLEDEDRGPETDLDAAQDDGVNEDSRVRSGSADRPDDANWE